MQGALLDGVLWHALVGGNCNNGLHCGAFYLNLNNSASNANWNIGASVYLSHEGINQMQPAFLAAWRK